MAVIESFSAIKVAILKMMSLFTLKFEKGRTNNIKAAARRINR